MGKPLNLRNPQSFNEKLQWLKLYDRNPIYTTMVDKFEAKQYVANLIGDEYIIPTIGVWNRFEEIDFSELPTQFVLKCTHDSGSIVIVKDRESFEPLSEKNKISECLKRNYFYASREWPYKNVRPRIIAEKYLEETDGQLIDYKIMCFNGFANCCFACTDRNIASEFGITVFDREWNIIPFGRPRHPTKRNIDKPQNYEKMLQMAEKLSAGIPFVRIDFYECNGRLYFGEFTFYPSRGLAKFVPEEWDERLGELITLPKHNTLGSIKGK
jgi:hypothetical protein